MSKNKNMRNPVMLQHLLATASAFALTAGIYGAGEANAADSNPPLWIEAAWQFERVTGSTEPFAPPFAFNIPDPLTSPISIQKAQLPFSYGAEGTISFQPEGTDWIFSAAVRYGRAHRHKNVHQETDPPTRIGYLKREGYPTRYFNYTPLAAKFQETKEGDSETHVFADFKIGKDVGLGLVGNHGSSVIGAGVRFAQINSTSDTEINGIPDFHFETVHFTFGHPPRRFEGFYQYWHEYRSVAHNERKFSGIGPTISWDASAEVMGTPDDGDVTFDWGVNAGLLFGRQKASGSHHTSSNSFRVFRVVQGYVNAPQTHSRSRRVIVPNLGGFAGISFRYSDAKLSLGYRGDFFLGALDGGIDARKSLTRGFHGPFASISLGLGD